MAGADHKKRPQEGFALSSKYERKKAWQGRAGKQYDLGQKASPGFCRRGNCGGTCTENTHWEATATHTGGLDEGGGKRQDSEFRIKWHNQDFLMAWIWRWRANERN